jgi:hypothetical protein
LPERSLRPRDFRTFGDLKGMLDSTIRAFRARLSITGRAIP